MTDAEIDVAAQAAKARVKSQADEARTVIRSLFARARESTGAPGVSSFALEGIEEALFDESAGFAEPDVGTEGLARASGQ